jgi:hypothetical protein
MSTYPTVPITSAELCAMASDANAKEIKRRANEISLWIINEAIENKPCIIIRDEPDDKAIPFIRKMFPDVIITWLYRTNTLIISWGDTSAYDFNQYK